MNDKNNVTVLIIDDRRSEAWFIERVLRTELYETVSVFCGYDGLKKTLELTPDLIVLDCTLPDLEAEVFIDKIRSYPETANTPVIFLTSGKENRSKVAESIIEHRTAVKGKEQAMMSEQGLFCFMTKPVDAEQIAVKARELLEAKNGRTKPAENVQTGPILIIDDNHSLVRIAEVTLEKGGFKVIKAFSGLEGISKAKEQHPSLVLLDIVLPELNGFEVLEIIRKFSDVPVIMLTSDNQAESVKRTMALGADDYLLKPLSARDLLDRVRSKLGITSDSERPQTTA